MSVNRTEERIELTAIDRASPVLGQVTQTIGGLRTGVDAFRNALVAVGGVVGAGAMLQFARETISATAALGNMATATGATVENLSRIRTVAKIGGHDFAGLTEALGKMVGGLKSAGDEGKAASHALEFLGVKAKDGNGRFRDTAEVLMEVAEALAKYEEGGNSLALVQDLLGKGAGRYLPLLKDMAEQGRGNATTLKAQAEQADALEKNFNRLQSALEKAKKEFVLANTGWLVDFTNNLLKAQAATGGLVRGLYTMATAKTGNGGVDIDDRIRQIDEKIAALDVAATAREFKHDPTKSPYWNAMERTRLGALGAVDLGGGLSKVQIGDLMAEREYLLKLRPQNQRLMAAGEWSDGVELPRSNTYASIDTSKPGSAAAVKDDYTSMARALEERIALMQAELAASEKLTDAQKEAIKIRADVEKGYKTLAPTQLASVEAWLKEVDALDKSLQLRQQQAEDEKRRAEEAKQKLQQQLQSIDQMNEENKRLGEQNAEIGLTTEQVGLLRVARIEETLARKESQLAQADSLRLGGEEIFVLEGQIAALRQLADLTRDGARRSAAVEQARAAREEWQRTNDAIGRGLTDALMRGFESGKGFGRNMLDAIVNMFKTAVLEPTIRPFVQSAAGVLTNAITGGSGGIPNIPGLDIAKLFGGGGGSLATGATVGAFGEAAGLVASTEVAALAGSGAGAVGGAGLMSGIGAALPWVGGALAVGSMLGLFDDGGGPKASDIALIPNGAGGLHFSQNNVTDTGWGEAYSAQFAQRYAKLTPEGRAMMNTGSWQAQGPATAQSMVQQYIEPMLRAAEEAAEKNTKAAEDQAKAAEQQLEAARSQERQVSDKISAAAAGMSGALGIDTLSAYRDSLSTSGYLAPADRLGGARAIFDRTYRSALGGDLDAVNAFPDAAQSLLGIARDTYASGSQFQSIFVETNRALNDVLGRQQNVQQELLRDVTATILEAQANNNVTYIRAFNEMKEELVQIRAELRRRAA